jgi:hypothetical protein
MTMYFAYRYRTVRRPSTDLGSVTESGGLRTVRYLERLTRGSDVEVSRRHSSALPQTWIHYHLTLL